MGSWSLAQEAAPVPDPVKRPRAPQAPPPPLPPGDDILSQEGRLGVARNVLEQSLNDRYGFTPEQALSSEDVAAIYAPVEGRPPGMTQPLLGQGQTDVSEKQVVEANQLRERYGLVESDELSNALPKLILFGQLTGLPVTALSPHTYSMDTIDAMLTQRAEGKPISLPSEVGYKNIDPHGSRQGVRYREETVGLGKFPPYGEFSGQEAILAAAQRATAIAPDRRAIQADMARAEDLKSQIELLQAELVNLEQSAQAEAGPGPVGLR